MAGFGARAMAGFAARPPWPVSARPPWPVSPRPPWPHARAAAPLYVGRGEGAGKGRRPQRAARRPLVDAEYVYSVFATGT